MKRIRGKYITRKERIMYEIEKQLVQYARCKPTCGYTIIDGVKLKVDRCTCGFEELNKQLLLEM